MQKILDLLGWAISRLGFTLFLLMTFVICLQVIMRYVFSHALIWPEEMTRYMYVWCSMCAVAFSAQKGVHLRIDALRNIVSPSAQRWFDLIARTCTIGFYVCFVYLSIEMVQMVDDMDQYATSFDLPMVWVWISFPLLGSAILLFIVARIAGFYPGKGE